MILLHRLSALLGLIPLAIGLTWTFVVLREIFVLGRSGAGLELAQALALVGGSIALCLWARGKARRLRSLEIDRHILHLAGNQREVAVADLVTNDGIDLTPEEASACLQRLAKMGMGSLGVSETGSNVFRLSPGASETIWLD